MCCATSCAHCDTSMWERIIEGLRQIVTRVPNPAAPPDRFYGDAPSQLGILSVLLEWLFRHVSRFFADTFRPALPELATITVCLLALMMTLPTGQDQKWLGWIVGVVGITVGVLILF